MQKKSGGPASVRWRGGGRLQCAASLWAGRTSTKLLACTRRAVDNEVHYSSNCPRVVGSTRDGLKRGVQGGVQLLEVFTAGAGQVLFLRLLLFNCVCVWEVVESERGGYGD